MNPRRAIVFNHFDSRKSLLVDPVHELPRSLLLICYLLNFGIKERSFCILNSATEQFPVLKIFCIPVFLKALLQFLSHQLFECFVMLTFLVYFSQDSAIISVKLPTIFFKLGISNKYDMFKDLKDAITSLMNDFSSLLPLTIDPLTELMFFSIVGIVIVNSVWSEVRHQSGWIIWLSSSSGPL